MMIHTNKLVAGGLFPEVVLTDLRDRHYTLGKPGGGANWQLVVVYRGRHCPMCTKYLNQLEGYKEQLAEIGIDIVAVSGDGETQLQEHMNRLTVSYPLLYGLTEGQMKDLGLYISVPRPDQETDLNFSEPGLFVVNEQGAVQVVDISNNPFVRPELEALMNGLSWIRNPKNNYPIRGTAPY